MSKTKQLEQSPTPRQSSLMELGRALVPIVSEITKLSFSEYPANTGDKGQCQLSSDDMTTISYAVLDELRDRQVHIAEIVIAQAVFEMLGDHFEGFLQYIDSDVTRNRIKVRKGEGIDVNSGKLVHQADCRVLLGALIARHESGVETLDFNHVSTLFHFFKDIFLEVLAQHPNWRREINEYCRDSSS